MPPDPDELFGEHSCFGSGLFGLRRIPLGALVGLDDIVAGFKFQGFEVRKFAVEFAAIRADQLVAFLFLRRY